MENEAEDDDSDNGGSLFYRIDSWVSSRAEVKNTITQLLTSHLHCHCIILVKSNGSV